MKVIVFGATGMIGQGVLRECLLDDAVESVLVVGRTALGREHPKLREILHRDFTDFTAIADELTGYDACFFCLGVSSVGMNEADYRRVTYDITLAAARTLAERNPDLTFIYVSGEGTDSSERGRTMWARVKGATENALIALPFHAYAFRPGYIQPRHGITSKTRLYRVAYAVGGWLFPVLKKLFPGAITTTDQLGRAMIGVALTGAPERVLNSRAINALYPAPRQ
jgi:uncharacterized protein YbjT (DUF2867 family)